MHAQTDASDAAPGLVSRVLIADGHAILRESVSALLALAPDFEIVGHAGSIEEAAELAERLAPDLILTDLSLASSGGAQSVMELKRRCPRARLVVLTASDSEDCIRASLAAGADGYVLKESSRDELLQCLRSVLAGHPHLCPRAAARVVHRYLGESQAAAPTPLAVTSIEREILVMVANGHSNKRIALALKRSVRTVEKHRAGLMRKLGLQNVADVTRFALENGILGDGRGAGTAGAAV